MATHDDTGKQPTLLRGNCIDKLSDGTSSLPEEQAHFTCFWCEKRGLLLTLVPATPGCAHRVCVACVAPWDYVVLDEIESLLAYLASPTLTKTRRRVFDLRRAKTQGLPQGLRHPIHYIHTPKDRYGHVQQIYPFRLFRSGRCVMWGGGTTRGHNHPEGGWCKLTLSLRDGDGFIAHRV